MRIPCCLVLAVLVTGCIGNRPHRTFPLDAKHQRPAACDLTAPPPMPLEVRLDDIESRAPESTRLRQSLSCVTAERHRPEPGTALPHNGFDLHTVEFDDQGRPWSDAAVTSTLAAVKTAVETSPNGALVVTFVHGWRHNGMPCDGNLACFRETLEILAKGETRFAQLANDRGLPVAPRRVIGVFVAWRGETTKAFWKTVALNVPGQFTFWGRKHTAHVIGDNGAVTALVQGIRAVVNARDLDDSTAVFVGHSFGGALLLSAMSTTFNGSLRAASMTPRPDGNLLVEHDGALFILVNPALEGSRFQNIFTTVSAFRFADDQLPVLLTLGSEADKPVKLAFPLGQSFSTWSRSVRTRQQWQSLLQGVGQYQPFHTHVLEAKPGKETPKEPRPDAPCACSSGLRRYGDALIGNLERVYIQLVDDVAKPHFGEARTAAGAAALNLATYREFLYSTLEQTRPIDPNAPFLTVKVDDDLVGGHSAIFNDRFLDFLIEYVVLAERKRHSQRQAAAVKRVTE